MLYKIELTDKNENLLDQYIFDNRRAFEKKYAELKNKYYYSAVMYVFIGGNLDELTELKDKRVYYNGLYEVQKPKITPRKVTSGSIGKILFYTILYILITPLAIVLKLGKK